MLLLGPLLVELSQAIPTWTCLHLRSHPCPVSVRSSCYKCPSVIFFFNVGSCITGENNQLVLLEEDGMTT